MMVEVRIELDAGLSLFLSWSEYTSTRFLMMVEVRIELDAKFLIYRPDYTERQYQCGKPFYKLGIVPETLLVIRLTWELRDFSTAVRDADPVRRSRISPSQANAVILRMRTISHEYSASSILIFWLRPCSVARTSRLASTPSPLGGSS